MTKLEALRIAASLTEAVVDGRITEMQAKNQFKIVARQYKNRDKFKQLQKQDPVVWMAANNLLGRKK